MRGGWSLGKTQVTPLDRRDALDLPDQIALHSIHMKRTNLVLSEVLLEEVVRVSGERTYSRAVERAMEEFVRRARARQILSLEGSGLWQGSLAAMREDTEPYRTSRRRKRRVAR